MASFHPDLAFVARFLPGGAVGPRVLKVIRALTPKKAKAPPHFPGLTSSLREIPGALTARIFAPEKPSAPTPVMLWIHGGGFLIGSPSQDDAITTNFARTLGITVVAPAYRLSPEAPFPSALDDLYATLKWVHSNATALNIRTDRIVIAGASAGGGLAAGLTLMARDRKEIPVAFQLLVYPMLDDRTVTRTIDGSNHRLWNAQSNRFGWSSYLAREPGTDGVSNYAAPARTESLAGLPPTWIGVGTFDLFHDEDVAYAKRLEAAGIPTTLELVPGAFHGFDVFRTKPVVKDFFAAQVTALINAGCSASSPGNDQTSSS